jgi:hypothetical protein
MNWTSASHSATVDISKSERTSPRSMARSRMGFHISTVRLVARFDPPTIGVVSSMCSGLTRISYDGVLSAVVGQVHQPLDQLFGERVDGSCPLKTWTGKSRSVPVSAQDAHRVFERR